MALVADYGPSSGDESEEESTSIQASSSKVASSTAPVIPLIGSTVNFFEDSEDDEEETETKKGGLGQFLPKPKAASESFVEESEEIGPIPPRKVYGDEEEKPINTSYNIASKKVKGVVKIAAPSLKDFDNDEDPIKAPRRTGTQPLKKGSGLFAILPEPTGGVSLEKTSSFLKKSSVNPVSTSNEGSLEPSSSSQSSTSTTSSSRIMPRSLIPDAVKQNMLGKRPTPSKLDEIKAKYLKQDANVVIVSRTKPQTVTTAKENDSDDSDDDSTNFFSFDGEEDVDEATLEKLKLPAPDFSIRASSSATANATTTKEEDNDDNNDGNEDVTTQGEIMRYMKQKKKSKGSSEMNFIDVKADDLRPNTTEWIKNITDESAIPIRRAKGLGGMQKRKHQITYLAVEAKAREQELQQQWANNRQTRRQTQMKYGF